MQAERWKLFESFLISRGLKECFQSVSPAKFARLTEGFSPRDLKKAAAEMEMKFLASLLPPCSGMPRNYDDTGISLYSAGKISVYKMYERFMNYIIQIYFTNHLNYNNTII